MGRRLSRSMTLACMLAGVCAIHPLSLLGSPPATNQTEISAYWINFAETAAGVTGGEMRIYALAEVASFEASHADPQHYRAALANVRKVFDSTVGAAARGRASVALLGATFAGSSDPDDNAAMQIVKDAIEADPVASDRDENLTAAARAIAAEGAVSTALSYADVLPEKYFERATVKTDIALDVARSEVPGRFAKAFDEAQIRLDAVEVTEPFELEHIYAALALAAATAGDWTRAEAAVNKMSAEDFEAHSWAQLAGIADDAGDLKRAQRYLASAQHEPGEMSASTRSSIAIAAASCGDRSLAESSLAMAKRAKPADIGIRCAAVTVAYLLREDAAADAMLSDLEETLAKTPQHHDDDEALRRLATALSATGHRLVAMRVASEIDATPPARLRSATFRTIGGDVARAGFPDAESKWIRFMLAPADAVATALGAASTVKTTP